MSKELEALNKFLKEYLFLCEKLNTNMQEKMLLDSNSPYNVLKKYLESIDNAKPSEALEETLRDIAYGLPDDDNPTPLRDRYYGLLDVKQALIKAQKQEKVLEIINEKIVNIIILKLAESIDEYNERMLANSLILTQEEFNLLKRYFNER